MIISTEFTFYLFIYGFTCFLFGVECTNAYRQNKKKNGGIKHEQL